MDAGRDVVSRVEFFLKTHSGYPRDAGVFFHSLYSDHSGHDNFHFLLGEGHEIFPILCSHWLET